MKIPVGKIVKWVGRALAAALAREAIERLVKQPQPKPLNEEKE